MNNIFQVSIPVCNILDKPNGNLIRQMLYGDRLGVYFRYWRVDKV
jgi:hypothetical protein